MIKPFDHLARQFSEVAKQIHSCDDPETRKRLLLEMRVIVDEADHLTRTYSARLRDESAPETTS